MTHLNNVCLDLLAMKAWLPFLSSHDHYAWLIGGLFFDVAFVSEVTF